MKKILSIGTIGAIITPIVVAVSCGSKNDDVIKGLPKHEYFIEKDIQDSKTRTHMDLEEMQRKDIKTLPANLLSAYKTKMLAGSYVENRKIYLTDEQSKTLSTWHTGIDIVLPSGHKIVSPVNGKLIASYWDGTEHEFADGIGGVAVIETNVKDLNVPDEYKEYVYFKNEYYQKKNYPYIFKLPKMAFMVDHKFRHDLFDKYMVTKDDYEKYLTTLSEPFKSMVKDNEGKVLISFMHLLNSTPEIYNPADVKTLRGTKGSNARPYTLKVNTSISPANPRELKRGDLIGYVGDKWDNGGWVPHVHANFYTQMSDIFLSKSNYKLGDGINPLDTWQNIIPRGFQLAHKFSKDNEDPRGEIISYLTQKGYMDPNNLYQLYDEDTKNIVI